MRETVETKNGQKVSESQSNYPLIKEHILLMTKGIY